MMKKKLNKTLMKNTERLRNKYQKKSLMYEKKKEVQKSVKKNKK